MNNYKCYKESGKFSAIGGLLIFFSTAIVGSVLFILYLLFNKICSWIYFEMLMAVIVSILLGWITGKIIRKFKMRNTLIAVICVMFGFFVATYVKWIAYDYMDVKTNCYKPMKQYTAYEYYGFDYIFDDNTDFESIYKSLHQMKSVNDIDIENEEANVTGYVREAVADIADESIWEAYDYDNLLGNTYEEAEQSVEKSRTMNAYDFTFNYRNLKIVTPISLLTNPTDLWQDILSINRAGRWSFKSSSANDGLPVKGALLWAVWAGELIILAVFMFNETIQKSKFPFIESENDWASEHSFKRTYRFFPPANSPKELKTILEQNPLELFKNPIVDQRNYAQFIGIDFYLSKSREENYLSIYLFTFNQKKKVFKEKLIKKYIQCDNDFVKKMEDTFK